MKKLFLSLFFLISLITQAQDNRSRAESLVAIAIGKQEEGGSLDEVSKILDEAVKLSPDYAELYSIWGYIYVIYAEKESDAILYEASFEKFKKSIELKPDSPEVYGLWAGAVMYYAALKEDDSIYNESFVILQKAIDIDPDFVGGYLLWGDILLQLAVKNENAYYYEESAGKYDMVLTLGTRSIEALNGKGWAYFRLGRLEKDYSKYSNQIVDSYAEAEKLGSQSAAYNLACYYSLVKEKDLALKWLEKTIVFNYPEKMAVLTKDRINKDEDFNNIRRDKRYKEILNRYFQ